MCSAHIGIWGIVKKFCAICACVFADSVLASYVLAMQTYRSRLFENGCRRSYLKRLNLLIDDGPLRSEIGKLVASVELHVLLRMVEAHDANDVISPNCGNSGRDTAVTVSHEVLDLQRLVMIG